MPRRFATFAVAAFLAGGVSSTAAAQPTSTDATGRWVTDEDGRALVTHGVNLAIKVPGATALDAGFGEDDVEFLVANGFNTVRLTLNWASVEPRPGVIEQDYLDEAMSVYRLLADAGIFVLLDMHQDLWGEKYGGFGHPGWSNVDDGLPAVPDRGKTNYVAMPALQRAFDSFWGNRAASDGTGLQDRYAAMWREVAARFAGDPHLLGYDLMNEPWPGSAWPVCSSLGCPENDRALAQFHDKVADEIRKVDSHSVVWYEPWLLSALGARTSHPGLDDPQSGFSFHNYCIVGAGAFGNPDRPNDDFCSGRERQVFERMVREHHQNADPESALLLSEFGATSHLPEIARVADMADEYMVPWHYWQYCQACQFLGESREFAASDSAGIVMDMNRPPEGNNIVDEGKLDVLVRPYPLAVAGTPISWTFESETRVFTLRYSTARADGKGRFAPRAVTEVFIPERHYPNGYRVSVEGGRAIRQSEPQSLRLRSSRGSDEVSVRIEPAGDH